MEDRQGRRHGPAIGWLSIVAIVAALGATFPGASTADAAKRRAHRHAVSVELALTAREARWRPGTRHGHGRLRLEGVAPRMVMMAEAPRRELAVVPASLLGSNWHRLFRGSHGRTNAVLSVVVNGSPRLYAVRLELKRRHRSGKRMVFAVTPLRRTAHAARRLGRRGATWEDATLLVDPTITDAIKAMWAALLSFFEGDDPQVPPNPTSKAAGQPRVFDNGSASTGDDPAWAGPKEAQIDTEASWRQVQQANLDLAGAWVGDLSLTRPDMYFRGGDYAGLALFNHDWGRISFEKATYNGTTEVNNLAIFESTAEGVSFNRAEVAGANLRALNTEALNVSNSAFEALDLTGAAVGTDPADRRGSVSNAAFVNVTANRSEIAEDGTKDQATKTLESGQSLVINNTDFTSVTFQDVDFRGANAFSATFQGCGLQRVSFSGATISGRSPTGNGDRFEPTFDNSILEDVDFSGAHIANVSFAGVDFSGGGVSLDGATLENVDFTGATGLQFIDWTAVEVTGNVYGLEQYGQLLDLREHPEYLRSITFDGTVPEIDEATGFDVEPDSGYLIDPGSGVRFARDSFSGALVPVDPETGEPLADPSTGEPLRWEDGELVNEAGETFEVDYMTGELER